MSDVVKDIPHVGPRDLINGLIEHFDSYRAKLEAGRRAGPGRAARQRAHPAAAAEADHDRLHGRQLHGGRHRSAPAPINAFHKSPDAIIGDGDTMVLPDVPATIFEGEAELAVIIGKRATNVSAADAMDYIFGYTNFIDGSARGLPPPALLPDEVARHLRADRAVHRHRRRDPRPAEAADPAVEQRHA